MFIDTRSKAEQDKYYKLLRIVGSLSNLFSDSTTPYLHYRAAENIFCISFDAENLSRSDCSADARKSDLGMGLKTFINNNGKTMQKIAEFNKTRRLYGRYEKDNKKLIRIIADLRNKRIEATKSIHDIESLIYHCVTRSKKKFYVFEQNMDLVDIDKIRIEKRNGNSIYFNDRVNEYKFNLSKSTLYKRFITAGTVEINVDIIQNPFVLLEEYFSEIGGETAVVRKTLPSVILPLYSLRGEKHVSVKSGLNQWNAKGRARHHREVYILIPKWIHREFEHFFPDRKTPFKLHLPNRKILNAKVCQDDNKALMSKPNKDLGEWLLDDVLKIEEGKLATYSMLEEIGVDSVEITKMDRANFRIDFKNIGSYDDFDEQFNKEK